MLRMMNNNNTIIACRFLSFSAHVEELWAQSLQSRVQVLYIETLTIISMWYSRVAK